MFKYATATITLLALLTTGCWYGTFMSPRAVGTGKIRIRAAGLAPAYLNSHDRDKDNEERGTDGLTRGFGDYFVKGMVTYGAARRFDIGLQGNMYSAGIHAKWWAHVVPEYKDKGMDFSPILFLDYIFETQRIAPKLSLVGGVPISRVAEAYIGYEMFYGPNMTLIDDVYEDRLPMEKFAETPEEYQDNLFIGCDFNFRDIGFTAEIGYPIKRNSTAPAPSSSASACTTARRCGPLCRFPRARPGAARGARFDL
jgi:hypothetical protein